MWTIPVKLQVAKLSQALAQDDIANGSLFGRRLDPWLPLKIYIVRKSVEFCYTYLPNDTDLLGMSNLMIALCQKYAMRAYAIISGATGGNVIIPITPTTPTVSALVPFYQVFKADFANTTDFIKPELDGKEISVTATWLNRPLNPYEFTLLSGGVLRILTPGFDSSFFPDTDIILVVLVKGVVSASTNITTYPYDLTATTTIPNMPTGSNYQLRQVVITPNGFTYAWDSLYEFTLNYPEQPDANGVGTTQIYTFMYNPLTGRNVCVDQSLNATS